MKKLTEQDYITGLDYSYILLDSYNNTMSKLQVLKNQEISAAYDLTLEAMANLYQTIGREMSKHEEIKRKTTRNSRKVRKVSK